MAIIDTSKKSKTRYSNAIKNITKQKNYILDKLSQDDDIAKLLLYQTPDCLSRPTPSEDEKYSLVNTQIHGYRYNMEIAEESKSYISFSMSNYVPEESFRHFSDVYLMGNIFFNILVDTAIMETETGYRQDLIMARIYELFDGDTELGIGRLRMGSMVDNWEHNNKFSGYIIGFHTVDTR